MTTTTPPRTLTFEQWQAEGTAFYGSDPFKWHFRCPACGHVQAVEDFRPFKNQGATPDTARFNCIGRYTQADPNAGLAGDGLAKGPCNYTSGGLFDLRPITVLMPDGSTIKSFAFADE